MIDPILRVRSVLKIRGKGRSSHYADIKEGLFTHPISIGPRARGWPESEVAALNAASIAEKTPDEIRALVLKLEAARKAAVEG
jgi:prophage regulatory protein